jgi:hypothetical protein
MSGHDDHRQPAAARLQFGLQLQAIDVGHLEIGQDATGGGQSGVEQQGGGGEGTHREALMLEQEAQRVTHSGIVVDHHDHGRFGHAWSRGPGWVGDLAYATKRIPAGCDGVLC